MEQGHISVAEGGISPPQPGSALLPIPRSPNKARGIWGEEYVYLQHLELEEVSLSDSEATGDVKL